MSDMYENIVQAMQKHWKAHGNANPQSIQLTASTWQALNTMRQLVNDSMGFSLSPGWEKSFQGVSITVTEGVDALVAIDGTLLPLEGAADVGDGSPTA